MLAFLKQYFGDTSTMPHAGRWHMQWHRKATFDRSSRFSGRIFHGRRSRVLTIAFWMFLVGAALAFIVNMCQAPSRSSPRGRSSNGKFRQY